MSFGLKIQKWAVWSKSAVMNFGREEPKKNIYKITSKFKN